MTARGRDLRGGAAMIVFHRLWATMKAKGISGYALRDRYGIDSHTLQDLRENKNVTVKTLDRLCAILDCRLEDIAEYIPDPKE